MKFVVVEMMPSIAQRLTLDLFSYDLGSARMCIAIICSLHEI